MYSDDFERIWAIYPRKINKTLSYKKFLSALKKVNYETIERGVNGYANHVSGTDPKYIAHFATWIGQERWGNDYAQITADNNSQSKTGASISAAIKVMQGNQAPMEREDPELDLPF